MAFPTTAVLDSFNRANGALGSNWDTGGYALFAGTHYTISSNAAATVSGAGTARWIAATYGPDLEAYLTIATLSGTDLYLCALTASGNGYAVGREGSTGVIYRMAALSGTKLGSTAVTWASGDAVGLCRTGDQIQLWRRHSGVWAQVLSFTDATYDLTGCRINFTSDGASTKLDDFGGGNIVTGPPAPVLEVVGHSYAAGRLLSSPATQRASALVAADQGWVESNALAGNVIGGAVTRDGNRTPDGWAGVANALIAARDGVSPYPKQTDFGIVWYGINDVGNLSGAWNARDQELFRQGLRFCISRMIASRVFDDGDASIAYTGFVSDNNGGAGTLAFATGNTNHRCPSSAGTGTATISVPADFPGGTVAVYLTTYTGQGSVWAFTVDGVSTGGNPDSRATGQQIDGVSGAFIFCQRFTGLAAGAHTIVCTATSISSATYFDSWAIEAPEPPVVAVPGQFKLTSTGYSNYSIHTPTDADMDSLDAAIAAVCAEFPPEVRYVNLSSLDRMTDMQSDGLEVTATGHQRIADLIEPVMVDVIAPTVTLTLLPLAKMSSQPEFDDSSVKFTVSEAYQAYEVRVVASAVTARTSGSLLESGTGGDGSERTIDITTSELIAASAGDGSKLVKVFAQDLAGNWST